MGGIITHPDFILYELLQYVRGIYPAQYEKCFRGNFEKFIR
jgi:hypothetical protein